jgi:hypothetical protein
METHLTAAQSAQQNPLELSNQARLVQAPDAPVPPSDSLIEAFLSRILKSPLRAIRTAGSVGGARSNPRVYPTWGGGAGEECVGGRPIIGQRVCLPQSPRELSEARRVGSYGLVFVRQALGAWAVSLTRSRAHARIDRASLSTPARRHCAWPPPPGVIHAGPDASGASSGLKPG